MNCPDCGANTKVYETRLRSGLVYRRRRCLANPTHRFSTVEAKISGDLRTDGVNADFVFKRLTGQATWLDALPTSKENEE